MTVHSIDLVYRQKSYRIAEPFRSQGAEIRPAGEARECFTCNRRFRAMTKVYRAPSGRTHCLACAMDNDALVEVRDGR